MPRIIHHPAPPCKAKPCANTLAAFSAHKKGAKPLWGIRSFEGLGGKGGLVFFHFALHGVHLFFDGLDEGYLGACAVQIVLRAVDFEVGVAL